MFFKVISYLRFLVKSTSKQRNHSPFVLKLIDECFHKKSQTNATSEHLQYRNRLHANTEVIAVTDFGAGSKVFNSNLRPIHQISKYAGLSKKRAALLIKLVRHFKPTSILEFGTSVGLSTAAMHLGHPKAQITTLEGCPNTMEIASQQFNHFGYKHITTMTGEFDLSLKKMAFSSSLDFVYFDGNHQKEATLKYFEFCLQHIHHATVFVFDDIHWTKDMEAAWEEIKQHPKVTATIDTYQWGLVFFRAGQDQEHLTLRV